MVQVNKTFGRLFSLLIPLITPFTAWIYRSQFNRKIAVRLIFFFGMAPIVGYFRQPYIRRQYKKQLQSENQIKEADIKQSLKQTQIDFTSTDNNFDYIILVRSEKQLQDDELFNKQKQLYKLNNQILQRSKQNENQFEGIKFIFFGEQKIYKGLAENVPNQESNNFQLLKKQTKTTGPQMGLPKQDVILLISKQQNGDNKILMEWKFDKDTNLKAIIRQIKKHKHKRYVQSMNFN